VNDQKFDKSRDAASYNAHAGSYDKYIRRLASTLADRICDLARLKPGDRVLDLGTGPGIAARRAAQTTGPAGGVLGIDLSAGMIDSARRSVAHWEDKPPEFRVMDAEALGLSDATFDAVISLCAVRHFPNIERALAEMRRVLKPGGGLVVSYGHGRPITPLPLARHIARRLLGKILHPIRPQLVGPAYLTRLATRLLPEPTQAIDTEWGGRDPQGALVRYVRDAGFERVEPSWWGHEVIFDSAQEFWEAQTSIVTQVRKRLVEAPPDAVASLKRAFLSKAETILQRGGKLIYPYGAFYVSASRPTST
jgi:ubiquinone/menaquinone biosynthesis C-methylase UbiE